MKEYFISLPIKAACNFETSIKAKSEKEAYDIAIKKWNNRKLHTDYDFSEPLWEDSFLDIHNTKLIKN